MESIIKPASNEMIKALDAEFEARKNTIRATKSEWTLKDGGTVYYISEKGSDAGDGKTPETAFATCKNINEDGLLKEGDVVLFERGGRWHDRIRCKPGVTYSAYGEGDKPKICGSIDASGRDDWTECKSMPGIYKYAHELRGNPLNPNGKYGAILYDTGNIIFNDGEAYGLRVYPENIDTKLTCLMGMNGLVSNGKDMWYRPVSKCEGPEDLHHDLEYYADIVTGEVYLMSVYGNPGERFERIDLAAKDGPVIRAANGVTIDNLAVLYGSAHGIGSGTCSDLTVRNCEIGWIGGAVQGASSTHVTRYGNAIEIYGVGQNFFVTNCYIYQAFDCGPTVQWGGDLDKEDPRRGLKKHNKHIRFCGNAIERCDSPLEVWITTNTKPTPEKYAKLEDIVLSDNLCRYSGYGFGGFTHYKADYNMFYGGGHTEAEYADAYMENNFFWHARLYIPYAVPTHTENGKGFNWRNNVIIKPYGSEFGLLGSEPENAKGGTKCYYYTNETIKMLTECGALGDNKYYEHMRSEDERFNCI
ncbi:MAG: right-handed parallel beta-helix repeat-containing protein [Clostridia bacterium]|nr:right-handed parallel beta-helix repeat-containing protein [Clostridia bacterium]